MDRQRGDRWSRRRVTHPAYFLRDRRGNVGQYEYLVVWRDLTETWEPGNRLAADGWANEMQDVDRWVHAQRQVPIPNQASFVIWSILQGIRNPRVVQHQRRIRRLWEASNSILPIRDWARTLNFYYGLFNLRSRVPIARRRVIRRSQLLASLEASDSSDDSSVSSD